MTLLLLPPPAASLHMLSCDQRIVLINAMSQCTHQYSEASGAGPRTANHSPKVAVQTDSMKASAVNFLRADAQTTAPLA